MTGSTPLILIAILAVIAVACAGLLYADLASGASRMAHESRPVERAKLPVNYWMGVAGKGLGALLAVVLAVIVWQNMA